MNREEYSNLPALNFSKAKHLLRSAAHFKAAMEDEEHEATDAQHIGTMAHAMVLEGKDLRAMYAIKPAGMNLGSKEGRAWKKEQTLPILKEDDIEFIPAAAEAIRNDGHASAMLRGCPLREHVVTGNMMGVECKMLMDLAGSNEGRWAIGDMKTCVDASPYGFSKAVANGHLDMQIAWYADLLAIAEGLEEPPFCFWIAVEKPRAAAVQVYIASEEVMASGRRKVERALTLFKQCQETGSWPGYASGPINLNLPKWAAA